MKVRELQEGLSKLDPELQVYCGTEDSKLLIIQNIAAIEGELMRNSNEEACIKVGKSAASTTVAILEVTAD